jgi:hypothetical protein
VFFVFIQKLLRHLTDIDGRFVPWRAVSSMTVLVLSCEAAAASTSKM